MSLRRHIVSPRGRNATHWKLLVNSFCDREGSYKYASRSARTPHIKLLAVARVAPPHRAFVNRAAMRIGLRLQPLARYCVARRRHSVPGPAKRRRYADPPAGAFLTGLATADWPSLRCGTDALFLFGAKGSALARARVKSRKIRDRPGRSPRPSARTPGTKAPTTEIRLCRPGDPPPPRPPLPLLPRSRRRAGVQARGALCTQA